MQLILAPKETETTLSWELAKEYCEQLTANRYTNWHLPSRDELAVLMQNCPEEFELDWYWTSSERGIDSPGAAFVDSRNTELYQSCWKEKSLRVRAVRKCK